MIWVHLSVRGMAGYRARGRARGRGTGRAMGGARCASLGIGPMASDPAPRRAVMSISPAVSLTPALTPPSVSFLNRASRAAPPPQRRQPCFGRELISPLVTLPFAMALLCNAPNQMQRCKSDAAPTPPRDCTPRSPGVLQCGRGTPAAGANCTSPTVPHGHRRQGTTKQDTSYPFSSPQQKGMS